ncbi:cobalamin biosynthesis protein CobD [Niastella caeni]|uniref:Cobalamin biosynthesis protein CobD n=1 Tax=Niastella caeni TaxID=2569763 RepID=A0A4S8HVN9_9BACT|nr:adenosylcobinamide-phosphate synthase CbiB [Niastella caeni]THU38114.1 cobalamin biosynthesis protein CobD [Niastella caeni]
MDKTLLLILPLLTGYLLDLLLGDPERLPHPIRLFGNTIYKGEKLLNKGNNRFLKGTLFTLALCATAFFFFYYSSVMLLTFQPILYLIFSTVFVYYGLANKSLIEEGKKVFHALEAQGIEAGRKQLSRIVGRDTTALTPQQIRIAVLETMSENLSDGVVAPLFYYAIAGVPGMMTYKMINTLDSMVGYRNERYEQFGKFAARLDDVANFIPARITALLMVLVSYSWRGLQFIFQYGNKHKSPNSGYPEAALAGIMDSRFGGPNNYHGIRVEKPFIGTNDRAVMHHEIALAGSINHKVCLCAVLIISLIIYLTFT